jgi:hypothetical protein
LTTTPADEAEDFCAEVFAPFAFGEIEARAGALAWIGRRWLAAPALSHHARSGPIDAVWVPFWLIDAYAVARWEGGVRGIVEMDFAMLPLCAEAFADHALTDALEPWSARALRPNEERTPGDRAVAAAELSRDGAIALGRVRMERELMATARRNQPKPIRERMRLLGVEYPRLTCPPALLPIWRFDVDRFGRRWRIFVNGVTGKATGRAVAAAP